jgi:hypothetical protein
MELSISDCFILSEILPIPVVGNQAGGDYIA